MEPEDALLCPLWPATGPYPDSDKFNWRKYEKLQAE
jgi:hypothetical protein